MTALRWLVVVLAVAAMTLTVIGLLRTPETCREVGGSPASLGSVETCVIIDGVNP